MNKPFLSLSMVVLCSFTAMAQTQTNTPHGANMPKSVKSNPLTANKTTATDSRAVGFAYYSFDNGTLGLEDSSHAYYNSNLGYDFAVDEWRYQIAKSWDALGTENYRISHTFDSKNRISTALYEYLDIATWKTEEMTWYTFAPNGQIAITKDAYYNGLAWDTTLTTYTYNTQGNILTQLTERYNDMTSAWENDYRVTNTYNSNGLLDVSLSESYNTGTSQWENGYRTTHAYNSNKQLITTTNEMYMMGNWQQGGQQAYTYDVNGNVSVELHKSWNGVSFEDYERLTHIYNGKDKISTTYESYVGSNWVNWRQQTYSYNSYHQSTVETNKSWDIASSQFIFKQGDDEQRYYYEEFPNSVKDATVAKGSMKVYPVPAGNELNLKTNFATAQNATVTMFDMTGRMVKQLSLPTATQHSQRVDVSSLPAGHYTVQLNAGATNLVQHVNIVK